jgi:hypothetical protein
MRTQYMLKVILFIIQCIYHLRSEINLNFLKIFRKISMYVVST